MSKRIMADPLPTHCPQHNIEYISVPNPVGRGMLLMCPDTRCTLPAHPVPKARAPQLKMAFSNHEAEQIVLVEREAPIQQRTIQMFELRGYKVLETSEHRRKIQCMQRDKQGNQTGGCGRWFTPPGGRGVDCGIPDLLIHKLHRWPAFIWAGIEMKGTDTPITTEQQILAAHQAIAICHSHEDAWDAVQFVERILSPVLTYFEQHGVWLPAPNTS